MVLQLKNALSWLNGCLEKKWFRQQQQQKIQNSKKIRTVKGGFLSSREIYETEISFELYVRLCIAEIKIYGGYRKCSAGAMVGCTIKILRYMSFDSWRSRNEMRICFLLAFQVTSTCGCTTSGTTTARPEQKFDFRRTSWLTFSRTSLSMLNRWDSI